MNRETLRVLGIETSCDETAAAVVTGEGRVLRDVLYSQTAVHAPYGGVVPELASRDHMTQVTRLVRQVLTEAHLDVAGLDAIAVTHRPGLVGALWVGVQMAKGMAWGAGKPVVGVDHLVGHLLATFVHRPGESHIPPLFPFVGLLASGGHTGLYRVNAPYAEAIEELGATRDDAAGECLDKSAKMLGLGYPGGPAIEQHAAQGDPHQIALVAPMASLHSLEFSFSGIKTQLAQYLATHGSPKSPQELANLCAAVQHTVTTLLLRKLGEAMERHRLTHLTLGGGVAANQELRQGVLALAARKGWQACLPSLASCTDNAAMIAYAGAERVLRGESDGLALQATSTTSLVRITRKGGGRRPVDSL